MPQFYQEKFIINDKIISLSDKNILKHLFVMRAKLGEIIKLIDKNKIKYEAKLIKFSKNEAEFEIINKYISQNELSVNICVAQVLLKNAQLEAVSNAVQAGAKTIQPIFSDFCCVKKNTVNIEKFKKTAFETFKQCERAELTEISEPENIKTFLKNKENVIIFGERRNNSALKDCIQKINQKEKIILVVGPEGGFSDKEFDFFEECNFSIISLGKTILKAENAIIAGVSNFVYEIER